MPKKHSPGGCKCCGGSCCYCVVVESACTPNPVITGATVSMTPTGGGSTSTCTTNGQVIGLSITNHGSGYTAVPSVSFSGGGGSGAAATATLSGGNINASSITAGGSGYVSPTVTVHDGGTLGSGATVIAKGKVTGSTLTSGGSGYTNGTGYALSFSGGGGTSLTGTFDVVGGAVTNIVITGGSSNFTSAPTLGFSAGGPGSGASAIGTLQLVALSISAAGTLYVSPTVTIADPSGTGAAGTVAATTITVASLTVTNTGANYGSAPTITIAAPPSGTTATATASIRIECCVQVPAGSYTRVVSASGYFTDTRTVTVPTCGSPGTACLGLSDTVQLTPQNAQPVTVTVVSPCTGHAISGVSVTSVLGTGGTTNGSGQVTITYASTTTGTDTITASLPPWFANASINHVISDCPGGAGQTITLGVPTGYICCSCDYPIPKTLHLTDSVYGAATLTFTTTDPMPGGLPITLPQCNGGWWIGTGGGTFPNTPAQACYPCQPTAGALWYIYTVGNLEIISFIYNYVATVSGTCGYGTTTPTIQCGGGSSASAGELLHGSSTVLGQLGTNIVGSTTCPPSFGYSGSFDGVNPGASDAAEDPYVGAGTVGITITV